MNPITIEEVRRTVGQTTYVGRVWRFPLHMPFYGDTTTAANVFRARNGSKMLECDVYLGVPYAEHPEGDLRWKTPQPYDNPPGEVDCSLFPDVPFQSFVLEDGSASGRNEFGRENGPYEWSKYPGGQSKESERIAHYHLFIPKGVPPTGGWPVVDWQHGGGWGVNSAGQYYYLAHRLAAMHGVAVRLPEYPLSSFGWMYDPQIAQESGYLGPDYALQFLRIFALRAHNDAPAWGLSQTRTIYSGSSAGGAGTLAMMEIPQVAALYRGFWSSSGGGAGQRFREAPQRNNEGYAALWGKFRKTIESAAFTLKDVSGTYPSLESFINAEGYPTAIRRGLSPKHIMALADAGERYIGFPDNITTEYRATVNAFPFQGGLLSHTSSLAAALNNALVTKPLVISYVGNEASLYGVTRVTHTARINPHPFAKLLGFAGVSDLRVRSWYAALSEREFRRRLAGTAIFESPAYNTAYAHADNGNTAYLVLWNYKSQGNRDNYVNHGVDNSYILGNTNWGVFMDADGQEMMYEKDLQMTWMMGRSMAAFAYTGNPSGSYTWLGDPEPFLNPPNYGFTPFTVEEKNTNVVGQQANGVVTNPAPLITNVIGYRQLELEAYRNRIVL